MFKNVLVITFFSAFLASCATSLPKKSQKVSEFKPEVDAAKVSSKDQLKLIEANLSKVTDEAMKVGPSAVSYLSSDLFVKGADASMRGDSQIASILFKYVAKLNPDDIYVQKKLAVEYIRLNKLRESKGVLEKIIKKEKYKDEAISLILGGVYTALEEEKKAKSTYRAIIKQHPKSEEACVFLAKAYSLDKHYKKAKKLLSKCEKRIKGKAIFAYYKGKIEVSRNRMKRAVREFERAIKIEPTYYQAVLALGIHHERNNKVDKAIKLYKELLKHVPHQFTVLNRLVQIMFTQGTSDEVIPLAERLSALDPSDLNLKVRLGILYTDAARYEDAKGIFKEILVVMPESDKVTYYLASLYQQTGDLESAIEYFSKIDTTSTLFHDSHVQIGQMLQSMAFDEGKGRSGDIAKRFITFVEDNAKKYQGLSVELNVLLAGYFESQDEVSDAVRTLASVESTQNFNESHEYYYASLLEKSGDFNAARKVIERLLEKNPDNPHALNFLGYSLLERGIELDKAFEYIYKAVKLKPNDGYIRDSLGWYYYKTGDLEKALVEIKKAWELVKTDVIITKHLALIYQKMKKYNKAKHFYAEALKNCKVESERKLVLEAIRELESIRLPASQEK